VKRIVGNSAAARFYQHNGKSKAAQRVALLALYLIMY